MRIEKIKEMIGQMTLEEKAGLCSGADFWHTKEIKRLGIPSVMMTDGPHGVRKQDETADHLGINQSVQAVCFPAGCATASSFDRKLLEKLGETIGQECQALNVSTILGPAINIKRSPLCGRNFEYYSEDPLVATELAGAFVRGVQSKHIGTSPKHFLANNQEKRRMTSSSEVDERTLREIYLAAFEEMVIQEKPWTMMCSYNRINGVFAAENKKYLTDVLRTEWGFDGYVMTDWGAMNDRVPAIKAGLELEMPASGGMNDSLIVEAVKDGTLEEAVLDQACGRMLNIIFRYEENRDLSAEFQMETDHEIAREIEEESIVLLKNEQQILPLAKQKKVVFIGKYAKEPRYQGGGSSHINSFKVESALDAVKKKKELQGNVSYAQGFRDKTEEIDEVLIAEAVSKAKEAEVAIIFAGLPDNFESEGYDRKHLRMPRCQNQLIEAVCEVQPNTVVVLHNGAPVEMPWISKVKGVVEAYLGGQAVGAAVVNVLYAEVNPSGRLAETYPRCLEDTPCYLTYGGEGDSVEYTEGIFVGYRYYLSKKMEVLFPFGYGLSYTTFDYTNLEIAEEQIKDSDTVAVSVDVTNTGMCAGKEVVQLYVAPDKRTMIRPLRELKAFEKIELKPKETKRISFLLHKRAFAYWNTQISDWHVEGGTYEIQIGKSAEEILLEKKIQVESTVFLPQIVTMNTTMGDIMNDPKGKTILEAVGGRMFADSQGSEMAEAAEKDDSGTINAEMMAAMMKDMPLRQLLSFVPGITRDALEKLIEALNAGGNK